MDDLTLEAALDLFKLPLDLGVTPEGEEVSANIGRFGPYVRYGSKFVSIRGEDPYTITLERALELIAAKKIADANRLIRDFPEAGIQVLNGRYGPYVTNRAKNAKIPKDKAPAELTLEECEALLAAAPERRARGAKKKAPAVKEAAAPTESAPAAPEEKTKKKTKKKKKTKTKVKKKSRAEGEAAPDAPGAEGTPEPDAAGE
jgi:DNA topoisomerase-1